MVSQTPDTDKLSPPMPNRGFDYVIVFRHPLKSSTNCLHLEQHVIDDIQSLTTKLTRAQLFYEVQQGEKRGTLLVLVGCPETRLYKEYITERTRDFLLGISLDYMNNESYLHQGICEADRLRLIHAILTSPEKSNGASISPHLDPFVKKIMPLHNDTFNKECISTLSKKLFIGDDELWDIRNHFGEKVAFYFAFAQFYSYWLIIPASLGVLAHFTPINTLSVWYSLSMLVWGIAVTETWKRKQTELSIRWNVLNSSKYDSQRGEIIAADQLTVDKLPIAPLWKILLYRGLALPGVAFGVAILLVTTTFVFTIQLLLHEYYTGPLHQYLHYVPTIGYAILIPDMPGAYHKWMRLLTNWEAHHTETSWEYSYTQKIFMAHSLVRYLSLFLILWIYIPFGDQILPLLDEFSTSHDHNKVDFKRLSDQLAYLVVTRQVVCLLMKTVVPQLLSWANMAAKHLSTKLTRRLTFKSKGKDTATTPPTLDSQFVKKVNDEVDLDEYDVHGGYADLVIQFGYISMFSPVLPLVTLFCIVNNWVQLRSDAIKMCRYTRRPIPLRAENTGPWIKNMETIVWVSSITMSSLAYLSHPTTNLNSSYAATYMLLSVLLSEHLYAGLRWGVQSVLSVFPNWSDLMIKKKTYKIKQDYHDILNQDQSESKTLGGLYKQDPVAKLWSEDADISARTENGIHLIRNHFKSG